MPWKEEGFRSRSEGGHHVTDLHNRRRKTMHEGSSFGVGGMIDSRSEGLRALGFATFATLCQFNFNRIVLVLV